ncbi:hypothetical protein ACWGKW_16990 [Streptomyces sp. NPDC054766]
MIKSEAHQKDKYPVLMLLVMDGVGRASGGSVLPLGVVGTDTVGMGTVGMGTVGADAGGVRPAP